MNPDRVLSFTTSPIRSVPFPSSQIWHAGLTTAVAPHWGISFPGPPANGVSFYRELYRFPSRFSSSHGAPTRFCTGKCPEPLYFLVHPHVLGNSDKTILPAPSGWPIPHCFPLFRQMSAPDGNLHGCEAAAVSAAVTVDLSLGLHFISTIRPCLWPHRSLHGRFDE